LPVQMLSPTTVIAAISPVLRKRSIMALKYGAVS